jgi:hypothetical protein
MKFRRISEYGSAPRSQHSHIQSDKLNIFLSTAVSSIAGVLTVDDFPTVAIAGFRAVAGFAGFVLLKSLLLLAGVCVQQLAFLMLLGSLHLLCLCCCRHFCYYWQLCCCRLLCFWCRCCWGPCCCWAPGCCRRLCCGCVRLLFLVALLFFLLMC